MHIFHGSVILAKPSNTISWNRIVHVLGFIVGADTVSILILINCRSV